MGTLLYTDFEGLNRDASQLHKKIASCAEAIKTHCGPDEALYAQAMWELGSGEFDKKGALRRVANDAGVLAQVRQILPVIKPLEFYHRRKIYLQQKTIASLREEDLRTFLLESRVRGELENTLCYRDKDGIRQSLSFEQVLDSEQKRRHCFLETCNDLLAHDAPDKEFDATQLHIGSGLAHNRIVTNQTLILPHFCVDPVANKIRPWYLNLLDGEIAGYQVGFGFAVKNIPSDTKIHAKDSQKRDCWFPALSLDMQVYEALMHVRQSSDQGRVQVEDTLDHLQRFSMLAGHDYLHHMMYRIMPASYPAESLVSDGSLTFEGVGSPFQRAGRPQQLDAHKDEYKRIPASFSSTTHEFFSFVMHRRILRHLFNSETIGGKDNVRGRNMKEAIIKSGIKFAADVAALCSRLEESEGPEKAEKITQYLATVGLSQLALIFDMDDRDMKKIYAAFEEKKIFEPYAFSQDTLQLRLARASGQYQELVKTVITPATLEEISPDLKHRYFVDSLKGWSAGLQPGQPLNDMKLTGEDGLKARILMSPWGEMCGWLNEKELGKDWCPAIAQTYYEAFMDPVLLENRAFKAATKGFKDITGSSAIPF